MAGNVVTLFSEAEFSRRIDELALAVAAALPPWSA
jgi:hypothetical protein